MHPEGEIAVQTGISTACLYPMETEKALERLLAMGYRRFEVFLNAWQEVQRPFLRELKARAEWYGASFVSVHPFTSVEESLLLFSDYPRRTEEGFRFYGRFLEAAAFLGGSYVVIHGQMQGHGKLSDEEYWERFGELTRFAENTGARPAQENVRQHRSGSTAFLRGMREYLGEECAFVLDVKQCRLSGCTVEETARAMGDRLCHVHLSDSLGEKACLLPGEGEFDLAAFRRLLESLAYRGTVVTEVYRDSFSGEKELEKAYFVTKKALET